MTRRPAVKPQTGPVVARGLAALGVASGAGSALVYGMPANVAKALPTALAAGAFASADASSDLDADYDLIVIGDGLAGRTLGETRSRLVELAGRLRPGGEIAVWLRTMAAPMESETPAAAFDALLFPEPAAAGSLGPDAELATLSASGWIMLFHACGLECVAQAGFGESPIPETVAAVHAPRLAVFDPQELATGRFLARFRRHGEAA